MSSYYRDRDVEYDGRRNGADGRYERSAGEWSESRRREPFARRGPRDYRRSDECIREDVGEYLRRHGRIDAGQIQVSVDGGEVTLSGIVGALEEKRLAENLAEACPGVKEVHNRLCVNQANRNQPNEVDVGELFQ